MSNHGRHTTMLKRFWNDKRGNFGAIMAVTAIPVTGIALLATDVANMGRKADGLQNSLDAAVLEIAIQADGKLTKAELEAMGKKIIDSNAGAQSLAAGLKFTYLGSDENARGDLIFDASAQEFHDSAAGSTFDRMINRSSQARKDVGKPACFLALSNTASAAVDIQGSTTVDLEGCIIAANSSASDSVNRQGSSHLDAECVQTYGGTSGLSSSNVDLVCDEALEHSFKTKDPLAGIVPPSPGSCDNVNINGNGTRYADAGTHCNNTLNLAGGKDLVLRPGTHIFNGTKISVSGNSKLIGSGVSIFLVNGATLDIQANGVFQITAQTTGTYAGIAVFIPKENAQELKINGTSNSFVQGFLYNPGGHTDFTGNNSSSGSACMRLISNTMEMTGNSSVKTDCTAELGGREIRTFNVVRLTK